jgi:hypothetical protein
VTSSKGLKSPKTATFVSGYEVKSRATESQLLSELKMNTDNIGSYWHYATIRYEGHLLGLLIETDDEEVAWREAEEISSEFGFAATLLDVKKVVIQ